MQESSGLNILMLFSLSYLNIICPVFKYSFIEPGVLIGEEIKFRFCALQLGYKWLPSHGLVVFLLSVTLIHCR